jgi:hypothetical protein
MKLVAAIRLVLALVLLCDAPVLIRVAGLLLTGGTHAVNGWVRHVALEGRMFDTGMAEQERLVSQAYVLFVVMLVVLPVLLYGLQRRLSSRHAAKAPR